MDRRADVVHEPRQGELGRPTPAADRVLTLDHADVESRPREHDRRGESVRARADDDRHVPEATHPIYGGAPIPERSLLFKA